MDGISSEDYNAGITVLEFWKREDRLGIPHCPKCWCTSLSIKKGK